MKAIICNQYGPPSNLRLENVDLPILKSKDLMVKVHCTTVNRTDCAILRAKPFVMRFVVGLMKPKHRILGTDFAGVITQVGNGVTKFKVGDRIAGFNDVGLQSHAEFLSVSEDSSLMLIPNDYSYSSAVASLEGAHYAYNTINKVSLEKGQRALVNGASGAIGIALLQFLKFHGLLVTAVCNEKNIALITSLGADKVIDYTKSDFTEDKEDYNFVFDAVGKSSFRKCKKLLNESGIYISSELGKRGINILLSLRPKFTTKKRVIFPIPSKVQESLDYVLSLISKQKFQGIVDREYPIEDIVKAYEYVEMGQKTGNVIVRINK